MELRSTIRLVSDGTVEWVDLTFEIHPEDALHVYFDGDRVEQGWTLMQESTPQRVVFDEPIPDGVDVIIRRASDLSEIPHVFHYTGNIKGGAEFNAKNMDENFAKILRASEDAMDSFELVGVNVEAALDANLAADRAEAAAEDAEQSYQNTLAYDQQGEQWMLAAQAAAIDAEGSKVAAKASEQAAAASESNAKDSELLAEGYAEDASSSESNALSYKQDAETARGQALNYRNDALRARDTAQQHQQSAEAYKDDAATSASQANASAQSAESSKDLAYRWANEPENQPVEQGEFSAYHWAKKAQDVVERGVVAVDSIVDLLALPEGQRKEGLRYLVKEYHAGTGIGGGEFFWDGTIPKSSHNGFTIIDPDAAWDGTAQGLTPFFSSANQGVGCFLLAHQEQYSVDQCGALGDGVTDDKVALNQALKYAVNLAFRSAGVYAIRSEVGAPTGVSDISIEGNGAEIKRLSGYTSKRMLVFERNKNLKVSNLRLNGNAPAALGTCEAITARACHGLRYDNLHVYDIREASASDGRRHIVRLIGCDDAIVANSSGINCSGKIFDALVFSYITNLDDLDYFAERGGIRAPIYRNCLAVNAGGVHHKEEPFFAMGQEGVPVEEQESVPSATPVIYDECVGVTGPNGRFGFRGTSNNGSLDVILKNTRLRSTGFGAVEFKPDIGGSLKIEGGQYITTRTDNIIAVISSGRVAPVSGHIVGAEIIAEGGAGGVSSFGPISLINTEIKGDGAVAYGVISANLQMERCTVEGFNYSLSLTGAGSIQDTMLSPWAGGGALRIRQAPYTDIMFTRTRLEGQVIRMDLQLGSQVKLKFDGCEFHTPLENTRLIREGADSGMQAHLDISFNECEFLGTYENLLLVRLPGGSSCKFSMQSC